MRSRRNTSDDLLGMAARQQRANPAKFQRMNSVMTFGIKEDLGLGPSTPPPVSKVRPLSISSLLSLYLHFSGYDCPSVCPSVSVCLSHSFPACFSVYVSLCLCLSVCLFHFLCLCLSQGGSAWDCPSACLCLSVSLSLSHTLSLSMSLSVCLSIPLSMSLCPPSIYLIIYLFVFLFVVCLSLSLHFCLSVSFILFPFFLYMFSLFVVFKQYINLYIICIILLQ